MKAIKTKGYLVIHKGNIIEECKTFDKAYDIWSTSLNYCKKEDCTISKGIITETIIEIGDKIHHINENKNHDLITDFDRTDVVTDIREDIFGSIRYATKEIHGKNRIGLVYSKWIVLA